jgi:phage shock protein A
VIPAGAAVTAVGMIVLERVRGRNRIAEIEAERDAKLAKIEAARDAEIAKIQAQGVVQVQLERERSRALTSNQLSIGPPPPG